MEITSTRGLELLEAYFDSDPGSSRVNVAFPINRWAGASGSSVVYFEVEPGNELPSHTDSAEEVLFVISGRAEARIGEESGQLDAGDLAVVPAMAPHGLRSVGDEPLRVVGFFGEAEVESTFGEPVQPVGASRLVQGAPPPATA